MNPEARQRSLLLEEMTRPIAQWTVGEHIEQDGTLTDRYGADWRSLWVGDVQQRIRHLAQALAIESDTLFARSVRWSGLGFSTRGVPIKDLQLSLGCLEKVIEQQLPPAVADPARSCLRVAIDYLQNESTFISNEKAVERIDRTTLALFTEAAMTGKEREAEAIVLKAIDEGQTLEDLFTIVLQPCLVEIGQMWHANEITIADEHAATAIVESAMGAMRTNMKPAPPNHLKVVATAIAGEQHAMGVRMVADLFELDGWDVLYLGANMPLDDIIHALRSHDAHLLAASVSSLLNLRALGDLIDLVRAQPEFESVKILVGGRPLMHDPSVWGRLRADGCAKTAQEAVRLGHQLLATD